MHKDFQKMDKEKYEFFVRRQRLRLQEQGFLVEDPRAFVSLNRVTDVSYDVARNCYYKVYSEETDLVPMQMVMKRRDPYHYLNVNLRCKEISQSLKEGEQVVCLNMKLFGIIGKVVKIDKTK